MGFLDNFSLFRRSQPSPAAVSVPQPTAPEPVAEPIILEEAPALVVEVAALPAELPISPAERAQAEELVRSVVRELPDYLAVAVLDSASGRILAGQWSGHSGGAVEVAAAHAELVQQARLGLAALQLDEAEQLEDIVITLRRQLHLLQMLPQQRWLLYLAARSQDANLALVRTVLRGFAN